MACPHYQIRIISRRDGESVVAAAAYQTRTHIFNEYRQQTENGNGSGEVVHTEILLPANAPDTYRDRAVLWNAVEEVEDQCNSQLARCIKLAIPIELPREQWTDLVIDYVHTEFVSKGMCADVAIHYKEPPPNPHAHILLTMREMDEHGRWLPKFRKIPCNDDAGNPVFDAKGHIRSSITQAEHRANVLDGQYDEQMARHLKLMNRITPGNASAIDAERTAIRQVQRDVMMQKIYDTYGDLFEQTTMNHAVKITEDIIRREMERAVVKDHVAIRTEERA